MAEHEWGPCPQGLIHEMVDGRRQQRRREMLRRGLVPAALVSLLIIGGFVTAHYVDPGAQDHVLTCERVSELYAAYSQGRLDDDLAREVRAHIEECPHCRPRYLREEEARDPANRPPASVLGAAVVHLVISPQIAHQ